MVAIGRSNEVAAYLEMIREGLQGLERLLGQSASPSQNDVYERRERLLRRLYLQSGMERQQLMQALREEGAAYQWIGQQVKKGYLAMVPLPNGRTRYTVTPQAVRELDLIRRAGAEEAEGYTPMSPEAFAQDWDSPEDSVYDRL